MFWKIWRDEYIASLRERTQSEIKTGRIQSHYEPHINDIVLVKDNCARGQWKFGKIINLLKGRDNLIRSASVVIPSGKQIRRPLNLLYTLEVSK